MNSPHYSTLSNDSVWVGRRVHLRGIEPDEWPRFREFDLDTTNQRNCDRIFPPRSAAGYKKWTEERAVEAQAGDEFWLVIADVEQNRPVGSINTTRTDPASGVFWYGVGVFPGEQRRGYAGEAIRIVQRYMFGERRYNKCQAMVYGDNPASLGLHQSLGFVQEGRLRKAVFHDGRFQDVVLFGMTVDEFRNLR